MPAGCALTASAKALPRASEEKVRTALISPRLGAKLYSLG
jgi:hypothetical protein